MSIGDNVCVTFSPIYYENPKKESLYLLKIQSYYEVTIMSDENIQRNKKMYSNYELTRDGTSRVRTTHHL